MCTVTLVSLNPAVASTGVDVSGDAARGRVLRMACNRDERHARPAALPPEVREIGSRRVILPIDPASDGTWVAVNDAGLAATVLNVNLGPEGAADARQRRSRGTLIPPLMGCASVVEADRLCAAIDPREYAPFRLILVDRTRVVHYRSDGESIERVCATLHNHPSLYTSSGLGDALVEGPRRALFETMFSSNDQSAAIQDAFHRHAWSDRRHLSVCMDRADARTVSHTVVEIRPDGVRMTYIPDAPDRGRPLAPLSLPGTEG